MEAIFAGLQKGGQNNVDGLVKWLMSSLGDQSKGQENKILELFSTAANQNNVTLDEFKGIITKVAEAFNTDSDGLMKQLVEIGPKLMQDGAASAATSAVKDLVPKF